MDPVLLWGATLILFFVGLGGILIPALPGIGFVYAGILLYAFSTNFASISVAMTAVLGILTIVALLMGYIGSAIGAKVSGGKTYAVVGTLIGTVLGTITGGPLGLFIGAFVGGLIGAMTEGHGKMQASKIAALAVVGILGASVIQFILALAMIAAFFIAVFV